MPLAGELSIAAAIVLLALAALHDMAVRTVPNRLVVLLALSACVLAASQHRLLASGATGSVMLAIAALLWLRRCMGGADVKLLAASGLLVGPAGVLPMLLATSLAGGALCLPYLAGRRLTTPSCPEPPRPPAAPARTVRALAAAPARSPALRGGDRRRNPDRPVARSLIAMLRILVLGIGGLLVSAFAVVAYVGLAPAKPPAVVVQRTVAVIATAHPVRAGSLLQPADLAVRDMPADKVPAGARTDSAEARNALVGAMVRRMLGEHDVVATDDVLRPGDRGFLAAVLAPGTRAVSVAVDSVSGEAGLIWPGDRVDLILTQMIEGIDQSLAHRFAGETVLGDVRVIAVDQQLVQGGQASGLLDQHSQASRTITLEVTPRDAARIAVATRLGKLQVVLRAAQPDALAAVVTPAAADTPAATPVVARADAPVAALRPG